MLKNVLNIIRLRGCCYCRVFLCAGLVCLSTHQLNGEVSDDLPTLNQLYHNYIEANGGYRHIDSLKSVAIKADFKAKNLDSVKVEIYRKRPSKVLMRKKFDGYDEELIFNGTKGWIKHSAANGFQFEFKELSGSDLDVLRSLAVMEGPFFLIGQQEKNIASISRDEVAGKAAYKLEINPDAGIDFSKVWLDRETFQEIKLERQIEGDDVTQSEEIIMSDLNEIDGHFFFFGQEVYIDGVLQSVSKIQSVRTNPGIYDNYFEPN